MNMLDILLDSAENLIKILEISDVGKLKFDMNKRTISYKNKILYENCKWSNLKIKPMTEERDYEVLNPNELDIFPIQLQLNSEQFLEKIYEYLERMKNSIGKNYSSNFIAKINDIDYTIAEPREIIKTILEYSVFFGIETQILKWEDLCKDEYQFYVVISNNIFYKSWFKGVMGNAKLNFSRG